MKFLLASILLFASLSGVAQPTQSVQKIGHADWTYIFAQMPEYKQIENELAVFESQLQQQLKLKSQELDNKYKLYQGLPASTPETIKKDKESELAYLKENIQKFQQDASTSMQKKQNDLVSPVFTKVGKAIEEVALENDFAYIVNPQMIGGGDVLLYSNEKYNISDLVLKKLGVTKTINSTTPSVRN